MEDYAPPVTIKMVDEGSTIHEYERRLLAKEGCASITQATLASTKRLTDENWWQEVRHVVFSASVTYAPGDVAVLVPRNAPRHVRAVLLSLRKRDATISLQTAVTSSLVNGTVEDVLSTCLDLATPLPQRSLGVLALFVQGDDDTSKEQRQKLKELSTVAGGPLYRDYVRSERRGIADVLVDFDRCSPTLEALVDACPRLRPRHYSIASCSTDTIELCVARALLETPLGRKITGLCSSWLCDLREGTLLIGVRRGEFSPINEDPLVFVGPGTGVAPARAFARSQPRNDMLLFFGCRHETKDRLYADEFAGLSKLEVDVSVSRHTDASQRRYVTKALRARSADVASWILDRNARFYIAGNAKMAADVALALARTRSTSRPSWRRPARRRRWPSCLAPRSRRRAGSKRLFQLTIAPRCVKTVAMIELLSPAGSLKAMRYAFAYGADAVYAGLPRYSLRARNNSFRQENIGIGIEEAHAQGKQFFLTVNLMPHNDKVRTFRNTCFSINWDKSNNFLPIRLVECYFR